jgi:dTDP-4-dehydrorhamnose reductase
VSGFRQPRICIIGGDAAVGAALVGRFRGKGIETLASTRRELSDPSTQFSLDLGDLDDLVLPTCDVVILAAAMARLAECRANPEMARRVNVDAQIRLAERARGFGAFVVFLSTALVFDGRTANVAPGEAPSPRSHYGKLKAETEAALLGSGAEVAIVRLGKVIGRHLQLFERWRRELTSGYVVEAFDDLVIAPIALSTVAAGIEAIVHQRAKGVWHLCGKEDISYFDAARHLAHRLGRDEKLVRRMSAADAGIPEAERPPHTALAPGNLEEFFGISIGDARTEIDIGLDLRPYSATMPDLPNPTPFLVHR